MLSKSALLAVCLLVATVFPAVAAEIVSPTVLKADWFDGRMVTTTGPRGAKSEFTFRPDGKVVRTGGREGSSREGTWRTDEDGFCMTLGDAKRESCYLAIRARDGSLRVMRRTGSTFTWRR